MPNRRADKLVCVKSHPRNQEEGAKKMHPGKPEIFSGFHLYDAINACSDVLIKYGGHELAADTSTIMKWAELSC